MKSTTFYAGTVGRGITEALQDGKFLFCFITDDGPQGQKWEDEYFADEAVKLDIQEHAIVLRIVARSPEGDALPVLFPMINTVPSLMIFKDDEVKACINHYATRDTFMMKVLMVLDGRTPACSTSPSSTRAVYNRTPEEACCNTHEGVPSVPNTTPTGDLLLAQHQSLTVLDSQLEAIRETAVQRFRDGREEQELEELRRPEEVRRRLEQLATQPQDGEERGRIRNRVYVSRAEPRASRRSHNKSAHLFRARGDSTDDSELTETEERYRHPSTCLHIRLPNGLTLRKAFGASSTLDGDVRDWIEMAATSRGLELDPYTFFLQSGPHSRRAVEGAEEHLSLRQLGLVQSALLDLEPFEDDVDAVDAYPAGPNIVARCVFYVCSKLAVLVAAIINLVRGRPLPAIHVHEVPTMPRQRVTGYEPQSPRVSIARIRNLQEFDGGNDNDGGEHLYNGYSQSFMPASISDSEEDDN